MSLSCGFWTKCTISSFEKVRLPSMHRFTSSAIFVKKAPLVLSRSLHQSIAAPTASSSRSSPFMKMVARTRFLDESVSSTT